MGIHKHISGNGRFRFQLIRIDDIGNGHQCPATGADGGFKLGDGPFNNHTPGYRAFDVDALTNFKL